MSALGDLLELMHGARNRYRTVRLTLREWQHTERYQRVLEEQRRGQASGSGWTMYGGVAADGPDDPPPAECVTVSRLWLDGPSRAREERAVQPGERSVAVLNGDWWWMYSPSTGATTNEGDPSHGLGIGGGDLLDPSELLAGLDLEVVGRGERAGRPVILAHARPRKRPYEPEEPIGERELEVDAEIGVVLRLACKFEGEEFLVTEVTEIAFDEDLPDELFTFEPPEGETLQSARTGIRDWVSIEEAAREAAFTVWIPARVPAGFRMQVAVAPGHPRDTPAGWSPSTRSEPASVHISYIPDNGSHYLGIREGRSEGFVPLAPHFEEREHEGQPLLVFVPGEDEPWLQAVVRVERGGTSIEITSDLPLDALLEIVSSLVPAPTDPPELVDAT